MISRSYKFKFYLNAKHFLYIDGRKTLVHPHTWELTFHFVKESVDFVQFHDVEKVINNYLSKYESKIINEIEPFTKISPTMEAIGEVIYFEIFKAIQNYEFSLLKLEISENAARTYIIKNDSPNFKGFSSINENSEELEEFVGELQKNSSISKPDKHIQKVDIRKPDPPKKTAETSIADKLEDLNKRLVRLATKPEDEERQTIKKKEYESHEDLIDEIELTEIELDMAQISIGETQEDKIQENINSNTTFPTSSLAGNNFSNIIISFFLLSFSYMVIFYFIYRNGSSPWGSDTWGHLFKSHFLYKEFVDGNIFPLYTKFWYNGIQPFRYWAPFTYYILLIGELISGGDTMFSLYLFNAIVFFAGAIPWILYGKKKNKLLLGTLLGILWFIIPDNYRVLFAEGNLPRVVVTTLFPYLLINIFNYFNTKKIKNLIFIFLLMFIITLSHAMISALVGITIFIFLFIYSFSGKKYLESFHILVSSVLGILGAGIWLFPALQGGIVSLNTSTNAVVMENLTYSITQSLNPFLRLNPSMSDSYYFGLSALIIALFGLLVSKGRIKSSFLMIIIIFLGTTKWFLFLIVKLPLSDLFWMMRFTPFAMAFLFIALLSFKSIKKKYMAFMVFLILIEGIFTMTIVNTMEVNHKSSPAISYGSNIASQRIGLFDLSTFDSYPSYFSTFSNGQKEISQVFGWAWQGATTAPNLVWINYALEKGYYNFIFDRSLEMGADTLIFRKILVEDFERLKESAENLGYKFKYSDDESYIFKYPVDGQFGTKVSYRALGIGEYSSNLTYAFPQIQVGKFNSLDDYSIEELKKYEKIMLSGFDYSDRLVAENKIKELAEAGVEIFVDLTHLKVNMLSQRAEFLGVIAQPVNLKYTFPSINYGGKEYVFNDFNSDEARWNTDYLVNLDGILGQTDIEGKIIPYYGWKYNENIKFVGLNLFYYSSSKRDEEILSLLEKIIGLEAEKTPERQIVPIVKEQIGNEIYINAPAGTLSDLSYLDSFKTKQSIEDVHNLIYLVEGNTNLSIYYPHVNKGLIISILGFVSFFMYLVFYNRVNKLYYGFFKKKDERDSYV